jgi:hypothetical protein
MTMYLYRKTMQAVTLATAIVVLSYSAQAQFRTPQAERKTPRAVGVLETFKNGSRRLVPVTFFYEKHYYDATFYHATPVPFTLYSETVYEIEQFGNPLGTFTVQSATENSAVWFGNGRFKPLPDPALLAKKHAPHPVVLEDPSKPVLHRREGSQGDNPVAARTAPAADGPEADEDPDRPKLHRREGSGGTPTDTNAPTPAQDSTKTQAQTQAPASAQAPAEQPEESSGQDPNRPKLHRKDDSKEGKTAGGATSSTTTPAPAPAPTSASTTAPASAGSPAASTANSTPASSKVQPAVVELTPSDDPDHPVLRRGQPVRAQSGHDLPDFKKEEPVSRQVAISDAGSSETQSLIYVCPPEERNQIEVSARELAEAELRRMAAQRGIPSLAPVKTPVATKTMVAGKTASSKKAAAKTPALPELKLEDEQFVPYDLDYNNYATVVYSARYTPEGPSSASVGAVDATTASAATAKAKSWVVTVVARKDEGKLIKLYSAVSDPRELDLYPEMRLVDAVDPDGYGRAALLFREQKRDGVSWLLGRMTGYELQTVFETPSR